MDQPTTELWLRVNGVQPAFGIEFGMQSPRADEYRASDPYRQANCSYSLLQWQGRRLVRHTLIDVGMGVVPSLLELEHQHGVHVVHEVVLSHSHFDHVCGLDWLANSVRTNRRPEQPRPLPVHASLECWRAGPELHFPYLADRSVRFQPLEAGRALELGDVRLWPFAVLHKETAPGALGFLVEHGVRRILLPCDFYRIPDEDDGRFSGADVCFLEATDWHPRTRKGHVSVLEGLELLRKWRPRRTYLVHYSGLDDRADYASDPINGPMSPTRMQHELDQVRGDLDVRLARHGMILGADTEWPSDESGPSLPAGEGGERR